MTPSIDCYWVGGSTQHIVVTITVADSTLVHPSFEAFASEHGSKGVGSRVRYRSRVEGTGLGV